MADPTVNLIDEIVTYSDGAASVDTVVSNYQVVFTDRNTEPELAARAVGMPLPGDSHPRLFGTARNISANPHPQGDNVWLVSVTYETNPDSKDGIVGPVLTWGTTSTSVAVDEDVNGKPIVNSADQGYDPPVQAIVSDITLQVVETLLFIDRTKLQSYINTVNGDEFYGFKPGQVHCDDISMQQITSPREDGSREWKVSYKFTIRGGINASLGNERLTEEAWYIRALNQGTRTKDSSTDPPTYDYYYGEDLDNASPTTPTSTFLNDAGEAVKKENATWKTHQIYKVMSFSDLNLGSDNG